MKGSWSIDLEIGLVLDSRTNRDHSCKSPNSASAVHYSDLAVLPLATSSKLVPTRRSTTTYLIHSSTFSAASELLSTVSRSHWSSLFYLCMRVLFSELSHQTSRDFLFPLTSLIPSHSDHQDDRARRSRRGSLCRSVSILRRMVQ